MMKVVKRIGRAMVLGVMLGLAVLALVYACLTILQGGWLIAGLFGEVNLKSPMSLLTLQATAVLIYGGFVFGTFVGLCSDLDQS